MLPVAQLPVAPLGDAFDGIELQERRHVHRAQKNALELHQAR
jgi:hypothetical protein